MDWNGDGLDDIIVGDRNGFVNYFRRLPGGALTAEPLIQCAGSDIDVGYNSAPEVVDWNEDGRIDLLVGDQGVGTCTEPTLRLYINQSSSGEPVFSGYSLVQADGSDICIFRNSPRMIDLDSDGKKDLLIGSCIPVYVFYLQNIGTNASPVFGEPDTVYHNSSPVSGAGGLKIWCHFVDGDMMSDLFVSDYYGNVDLYLSDWVGVEGESTSPAATGNTMAVTGTPSPGPFGVSLSLAAAGHVEIEVFGLDGRRTGSVYGGWLEAGTHTLPGDLGDGPPGVYIVSCTTGQGRLTASLVMLE